MQIGAPYAYASPEQRFKEPVFPILYQRERTLNQSQIRTGENESNCKNDEELVGIEALKKKKRKLAHVEKGPEEIKVLKKKVFN